MASINVNDKLVKKAGDKEDVPMTPEQSAEWLKCANDKYYFFENYVYVQAPKGKMLFKPRDYQKRIIDQAEDHRFTVSLMGRQSGKCGEKNTKVICSFINSSYEIVQRQLTLAQVHVLQSCTSLKEVDKFIEELNNDLESKGTKDS